MALTQLQEQWIADVLGVDLRKFSPAPGGRGAPGQPAAPSPKAAPTARVTLVIDNRSDRTLRLVKAENDGGRFDPPPPAQVAPKKKVSVVAVGTGATGGTLIYQLQAGPGEAAEPDQLPWWQMRWKPIPDRELPDVESSLDSGPGSYSASGTATKDSIAFVLSGTSTAPQAGRRRIDVTFVNRSDQWLKYSGADTMKVTFDKRPPEALKPGATATFAIFGDGSDEIHFGLLYSIVPTENAPADAGAPKWTPHFDIPAGTMVMVAKSGIVPGVNGLQSSENPSPVAVSFVLSGSGGASSQPPQVPHVPFRPQDVEQQIPVTLTNDSDRVLRYWGADRMVVTFVQRPPGLIKPGQSFTFAIKGKRGTEISFGLMYAILANDADKADDATPKWVPYFKIPPAQAMLAHSHITNPGVPGLKAGGWPDKSGALFVLSGTAVAPGQPAQVPQVPLRPQDVLQRVPVTLTNSSNMVLRYWGADKMVVTFEQRPPPLIKPGQSFTFAIKGKRGTEISFSLMYSILANETDKAENATPQWIPSFRISPVGDMVAEAHVEPGMGGLKAGGWPDKEGALFALSGTWVKDQELTTPVSIRNLTKYRLRLVDASAAPGRFDPAAPAEIAPGATATFASRAKVESDQKVVYELEAPDGKKTRKRRLWTMTWHTTPGSSPRVDRKLENIEKHLVVSGLDGDDGVSFELEIKDDR